MDRGIGIVLVVLGGIAVLLGLLTMSGALSWFGRLPGDIRIARGDTRVYVPLASGLLVSVVLTVVVNVLLRLLR